jgi:hypothetical protein
MRKEMEFGRNRFLVKKRRPPYNRDAKKRPDLRWGETAGFYVTSDDDSEHAVFFHGARR